MISVNINLILKLETMKKISENQLEHFHGGAKRGAWMTGFCFIPDTIEDELGAIAEIAGANVAKAVSKGISGGLWGLTAVTLICKYA
jgi:hypothetical protein